MKEIQRWIMPACAIVTAGSLLTACGGTAGRTSNASGQSKISSTPSADPSGAADEGAGEGTGSLESANDSKLGKIVVDDQGRTLYRFDKDTANPPKSNCEDDCATAWPPVMANEDDVSVKGVDANLLGKVKRADGSEQLTLNGWPLYRYAKDTDPGDAKGQGVGGTWYVSTPEGKKAGVAPKAPKAPRNNAGGQGRWAGWTVLKVKDDPKLGKIVTDGKGNTLYRFDKDQVKPTIANCLGQCAKAWPPVKFTSKLKLTGIDRSKITNIMRKDGICQLALGGWPLYRYSKDLQPGDTNGQGVGGTWFVSDPHGKKALGSGSGGGDTGSGYGGGSGY